MTRPRCTKIKVVEIFIPPGVVLTILLTFYIVVADRNAGVAALAQRHEILFVVLVAVCKWKDVMHFLCGRQTAMLYNKARGLYLSGRQPTKLYNKACGICLIVISFVFHQAALGSAVYHQARKSESLDVAAPDVWLPAKGAAPYLEP